MLGRLVLLLVAAVLARAGPDPRDDKSNFR